MKEWWWYLVDNLSKWVMIVPVVNDAMIDPVVDPYDE